jgi:hypothetical protein
MAAVTYKKPSFTAFTAGKAAFGLLGAAAMISEGNDIVAKNNITDPAINISQELKSRLVEKFELKDTKDVSELGSDTEEEVAKAIGKDALALDVKTLGWMFNYFPTNWTHYRVTYSARARIFDTSTGKLVAQIPCTYVSDDEKTAVTYDQLLENNAALLKSKLESAGKSCTNIFMQHIVSG